MIEFDSDICRDFAEGEKHEWLETNGIGGYAASTINGSNSRRYHGLLTAALNAPLGRVRLVSKIEETVTVNGVEFDLSANRYRDAIHPRGFLFLKSFKVDPFPIWRYSLEGVEIERSLFMVHGENTTVIRWNVISRSGDPDSEISFSIKPLVSCVDYHHLRHADSTFTQRFQSSENCVLYQPTDDAPEIFFNHSGAEAVATGNWYFGFEYPIEAERGFDSKEDLFQPFELRFQNQNEIVLILSTKQQDHRNHSALEEAERDRRDAVVGKAKPKDEFAAQLALAADQFIVKRGEGHSIIAGYPWFSDWGRDTMIALPGLALSTNRPEIAREILFEYSKHISQGMLPNRFPDIGDSPEYNTVDATLWYFEAIRAYVESSGDFDFVKEHLYGKLVEIIWHHLNGTRYGIKVDKDGLLFAGDHGSQLTWMDAKYGDEVFTPRAGKPVEIQALWYNALETMREFASAFDDTDGKHLYRRLSSKASKSFNKKFWNKEEGYLYDVIGPDFSDASVRPNMIFAVSLKHSMVSMYRAKLITERVTNELFTPYGLRSLSPNDPRYCGVYSGSPYERDSAYHQGTVWTWLMGAYVDSLRRTYPKGRKLKKLLKEIRSGLEDQLREQGIGQLSEIYDGNEPHKPRGCFAQAWSVAEILRVLG
ncbi:MAG: amylo-alpha-1,6-glucosidase [Pyrinomonadaceae bacterium]